MLFSVICSLNYFDARCCDLCHLLTCTELKATVCVFLFLAMCARLSCILSFRVHVKLFYRIVSY